MPALLQRCGTGMLRGGSGSVCDDLATRDLHQMKPCGGGIARLRWCLLDLQADGTWEATCIRGGHWDTLGLWQVVCYRHGHGLRIRRRSV